MSTTKVILLAWALAFSTVNAHMTISSPIPFGKSSLSSAPLAADGSDFPCKQRPGVYDVEGANNPPMAIGAPQTLAFIGGATHGGGSCQVSLTTDKKPTKDSKWQVIHSIEGNCPDGFDGNLSGNPNDTGSSKFQYSIPDGIAPGDYVLAWTWFNRIGNREMYMNCAPITVVAGSKKRDETSGESVNVSQEPGISKRASSFPDMFIANIGNGCTTAEGGNVAFPDAGSSVEQHATFPSQKPVGTCAVSKVNTGSGNSGSGNTGNGNSGNSNSGSGNSGSGNTGSGNSGNGNTGNGQSGNGSSGTTNTPPPSPSAAPPAQVATPSPAPANPPVPSPAPGGSTNNAAQSSPGCTPGKSVCSPDGRQIGTCDATGQVTFINVAQGTKCQGGYMVLAGRRKRNAKFIRAYGQA